MLKYRVNIHRLREVNKVVKWKSCHPEREMEHSGVTMAKPLWPHTQGINHRLPIPRSLCGKTKQKLLKFRVNNHSFLFSVREF
jgi:hypothetical protein